MGKDVYVANLNPGVVRHEYVGTLIELLMHDVAHDGRIACYVPRLSGGCLGIYRNLTCEHFLDTCEKIPTLEYLFFIDSDIQLKPDTLDVLLATEAPLIAGLYYMSLDGGIKPSVFDYKYDESDDMFHMVPRDYVEPNAIIPCGGTGAGCLLIHKDVLAKLLATYGRPSPWFAESVHGGVAFGEDFTFCLRANAEGYPILVHTGAEVGHVKNVVLSRETAAEPSKHRDLNDELG